MVPHLDPEGLEAFKNRLSKTKNYLEYGCGGSTFLASSFPLESIISVDSDKEWVEKLNSLVKVENKIISIRYCNIGSVQNWGIPIDSSGYKNYWEYIVSPWKHAESNGVVPDTILIDGRFRVACFLYSLTKANSDTVILFDDYTNRPEYSVVTQFLKPRSFYGRMAEFKGCYELNFEILNSILKYSCIYD
jgi:hypothetical protein